MTTSINGLYIKNVRYADDDKELFSYSYCNKTSKYRQQYSIRLNEKGQVYMYSKYTQEEPETEVDEIIIGADFQGFYYDLLDEDNASYDPLDEDNFITSIRVGGTSFDHFPNEKEVYDLYPEYASYPGTPQEYTDSDADPKTKTVTLLNTLDFSRKALYGFLSYKGLQALSVET